MPITSAYKKEVRRNKDLNITIDALRLEVGFINKANEQVESENKRLREAFRKVCSRCCHLDPEMQALNADKKK